jgi:hypothetical protein
MKQYYSGIKCLVDAEFANIRKDEMLVLELDEGGTC